jgi:hypothetical protein
MTAMSKWIGRGAVPAVCLVALTATGCGDFVRQGTGSALVTVAMLEGASGVKPADFGNTLSSDVITYVKKTVNGAEVRVPTTFSDPGRATVTVEMKDTSDTSPSSVNSVTFNRYRVTYVRADGRNAPAMDVPASFDSAVTFTVAPGGSSTAGFDLVRNVAKQEAPLVTLANNQELITVIAQVTFYGRDHAGHDVTASGNIGITFGNFGDPD